MSRRNMFIAVATAIAILTAIDWLVERKTMNSIPRQAMRTIVSATGGIDVLGIGNSLIGAGFDPIEVERTFQASGRSCNAVNGALGASSGIEHLALTRLAWQHHSVETIVYGFFDQQLSSDMVNTNAELIGNHSMLYYLEPQLTLQHAGFDTLNRLSFHVYRSSALLRERGSLWARVEKLRRTLGSIGMPPQETNQFGRKADFSLLEAGDSQKFALACEKVIRSNRFLSSAVQALLEQAREKGVKVLVVEMPMHPLHRKKYYDLPIWGKFRAGTQKVVEGAGASYWNASALIPDAEQFVDYLHLSKEGAQQFSRLLAEKVMEQSATGLRVSASKSR